MKKLLVLILFLTYCILSFSQTIVVRGKGSTTQLDSNLFIANSFKVPVFADTSSANSSRPSLDSAGKVIYTRDVNWFWGRQTTPSRKWVSFNNSTNGLTSICGYPSGTHIVTYDSVLNFDVTAGPYALCCDQIPRFSSFTLVTLDTNSTSFPRYDLIILDSNGVSVRKGVPAANPATPQTDSCEIILTYVLINANDSVPSFVTQPYVIYDETISGEWLNDTTDGATIDTADLSNPAHLTHDLTVSSFSGNQKFSLKNMTDSIDLNNYNALKFYILRGGSDSLQVTFTWYLDSTQKTFPVTENINSGIAGYQTIIIPISSFPLIGNTSVNRLVISMSGTVVQFYLDWIQLQTGSIISNNVSGGVRSVGAGNLDPLFSTVVNNATSTPVLVFSQQDADGYSVLGNRNASAGPYSWGKVNLGTQVDSLLDVSNLGGGNDGDIIIKINNVWTPINDTLNVDTIYTYNGISVARGLRDTLYFGGRAPDSSKLAFDTYLTTNGYLMEFLGSIKVTDTARLSVVKGINPIVAAANILRIDSSTIISITPQKVNPFGAPGFGWYPISISQTLDSNYTASNNAGAVSAVKTFTLGTSFIANHQANFAATSIFNAPVNQVAQIGFCSTCGNEGFFGYNQYNGADSSGFRFPTGFGLITPTIYIARNEISGSSATHKLDADSLYMVGFGVINRALSNVDTIGAFVSFEDYGLITNSANHIVKYYSFLSGISPSSNTDSTFGFYQVFPTVRNWFGGLIGSGSLKSGGTAPTTNGVTKPVIVDADGYFSFGAASANPTLQQVFNTEVGGSVLTKIDSIQIGAFELDVYGSGSNTLVATNTTGIGFTSFTTSGVGISANTTTGIPAYLVANPSSTNSIVNVLLLERDVSGTAANGLGQDIRFSLETSNGSGLIANKITSAWTDATTATATSQMVITGMLSAATVNMLTLNSNGSIQWTPITATAASAITPAEGMVVMVSSTNGTFTSIGFWGYQNGAWHAF